MSRNLLQSSLLSPPQYEAFRKHHVDRHGMMEIAIRIVSEFIPTWLRDFEWAIIQTSKPTQSYPEHRSIGPANQANLRAAANIFSLCLLQRIRFTALQRCVSTTIHFTDFLFLSSIVQQKQHLRDFYTNRRFVALFYMKPLVLLL